MEIDFPHLTSEFKKLFSLTRAEVTRARFDATNERLHLELRYQTFNGDLEISVYKNYYVNANGITWDYYGNQDTDLRELDNDHTNRQLTWEFITFLKDQFLRSQLYISLKLKSLASSLYSFPKEDLPNMTLTEFKSRFRNVWCLDVVNLMRLSDGRICQCVPDMENENNDQLKFAWETIRMNYDEYSKNFVPITFFDVSFIDFVDSNFDVEQFNLSTSNYLGGRRGYTGGFTEIDSIYNDGNSDYDDAKSKRDLDNAFDGD